MSESRFKKMCKALDKLTLGFVLAERELSEDNERLREDNEQLRDDIERLRELLRQCVPYLEATRIAGWTEARELFGEILKEVGDE